MVNKDLPQLVQKLEAAGRHITIETAGVAYIPQMPCDLMSISPKLSNSVPARADLAEVHERLRFDLDSTRRLIETYRHQLKFVIESETDLDEIQRIVETLGDVDRTKVLLMPQAVTRDDLLARSPAIAAMCRDTGFSFGQRLHLLLWDTQRGV